MKRWFAVLTVAVMALSFLGSGAYAKQPDLVTPGEARLAAVEFVDHLSRTAFPSFLNGNVGSPTRFENMAGDPVSFVFPVTRANNTLGYVVVGANKNDSPFLEASQGSPPQELLDVAKDAILSKYSSRVELRPPRLLHLNALAFIAEFPVFREGEQIGLEYFHLKSRTLLSPEQLPAEFQLTDPGRGPAMWDKLLNPPDDVVSIQIIASRDITGITCYDQSDSSHPDSACGPTVGAELMTFWKSKQYSSIRTQSYYGGVTQYLDHMYADMGYPYFGTSVTSFKNGITSHMTHSGYSSGSYTLSSTSSPSTTYSRYTSEINSGWPVGVRIDMAPWDNSGEGNYDYHWVLGYGYDYNTNIGWNGMHIYNSWDSSCSLAADVLDYDRYQPYLSFVYFH